MSPPLPNDAVVHRLRLITVSIFYVIVVLIPFVLSTVSGNPLEPLPRHTASVPLASIDARKRQQAIGWTECPSCSFCPPPSPAYQEEDLPKFGSSNIDITTRGITINSAHLFCSILHCRVASNSPEAGSMKLKVWIVFLQSARMYPITLLSKVSGPVTGHF